MPSPVTTSSTPPESLSGLIERVTFFNEENGFAVLKVKVKSRRDLVTVVGALPSVSAGEWLTAQGRWTQERDFGLQFRAEMLSCSPPQTLEGIEKFLGSGMIKGIGPVYAGKLVRKFGTRIFEVIEKESGRLQEVEGVGPMRRKGIKAAWEEQKAVREIMVFLHSNGVSTSRAVRIFKTYGAEAIDRVRANPYVLAQDIAGIGFKTADQIAEKLGIPHDSLLRAQAGLRHVLLEATQAGHCGLPVETLKEAAAELLLVESGIVEQALEVCIRSKEVAWERIGQENMIFLPMLKQAEEIIAGRVLRLCDSEPTLPPINVAAAVEWCEKKTGKSLAPSQRAALEQVLGHRIAVITGGPGVGKTTLVNSLLLILRAKKVRCLLCAPTGRAAKRLSEVTGFEARTIHRMLEVQPGRGFTRHETNPLEADLLVVDETSMIDVPLMAALVRALPSNAHLLLVGDIDQLPSVGPGMVLRDLVGCGRVPVVRLTEVFRQAAGSRIIANAHLINQGQVPDVARETSDSDFYFIERETPERIVATLLEVVKERIPARFKLSKSDIQVLAPMNRGSLGIRELNQVLQRELNPPSPELPHVEKFGTTFQPGDRVMQTENNYDKEVFNGDIGRINAINLDERELKVTFDQREVVYDFGELDELSLAYAITIHKAQGSEFPAVVIPLATQHYLLLQRNLIYTGVTRGKRLVVLVGQPKALAMAVRNQEIRLRHSGLLARLRMELSSI